MSNLVIVIFINIFFCFALFFYWFFLIASFNVCLIKNIVSLFFRVCFKWSQHSLMTWVLDLKISLSWFPSFLFFFKYVFLQVFFSLPVYKDILISCRMSCVWFIDSSWLSRSLEAFLCVFFAMTSIFKLACSEFFDRTRI